MTTVTASMRRSYSPTMFADLTDVAHTRAYDKATGVTTLTFADELDEETAAAIWARMESKDDDDQAARAALRAARTAVMDAPNSENVAALAVLSANYVLGDTP